MNEENNLNAKKQIYMRKLILAVVGVELIILLIIGVLGIMTQKRAQPKDLDIENWKSEFIRFENGAWYTTPKITPLKDKDYINLVRGPDTPLESGSYRITVNYECTSEQKIFVSDINTNNLFIRSCYARLDPHFTEQSWRINVQRDIEKFRLYFRYSGEGDLKITGVTITNDYSGYGRTWAVLFGLFIAADLCLIFYKQLRANKELVFSLIAIIVLSSLPVFIEGCNRGNDYNFHILRIEGLADALSCGIFPVRVQPLWLEHYGYPVSIYYGDLLLYFPAVLRLIGFDIINSYKAYVVLINTITVLSSYFCFKDMFKHRSAALLTALAYSTASYRLVNIYIRAAVGEYTSMAFFPLIALGIYRIYTNNNRNSVFTNSVILCLGMTGVITSHILSTEMTVVILVLLCLSLVVFTIKPQVLKSLALAAAETAAVCAAFIVPFLDYYKNVQVKINDTVSYRSRIQSWGCGFVEYFAFFSDPHNDFSTHRSADMSFTPGIILMGALFVGIYYVIKNKKDKVNGKILFCSGFGIATLYLASNVFPWNKMAFDSKLGNMIAQVQFPWRYIGITIVFLTVILGLLLKTGFDKKYDKMSFYTKIIVILCIASTALFTGQYLDDQSVRTYYDTADLSLNEVSTGEYLRSGSSRQSATGKFVHKGADKAEITEHKGTTMKLYFECPNKEAHIEIPMFNYKGYVVQDDLSNSYEITDGKENVISFTLPKGFKGNIIVSFKEPASWRVSEIVSLLSIAAIAIYTVMIKRRSKTVNTDVPKGKMIKLRSQ
ncbi:MAG: hypothetical protein II589_00260 [Clostridia bacterium]|nr:hypothetical protein [Clostridia bacterium]